MIERIRRILVATETALLGLFLGIVAVAVFSQVVTRMLEVSVSWFEELARFAMVWGTLVGAALALEVKALHRIDVFTNKLPEKLRRGLAFVLDAVVMALLVTLTWKGAAWALTGYVRVQTSSAMEISMSWVYAAVPFGCGLMLLSMVLQMLDRFRGRDQAESS